MKSARTKRWIGSIGLTMLLTAILLGYFSGARRSELPAYQGKNIEEWFWGENRIFNSGSTIFRARRAFREVGTNGIPFLLDTIRRKETLPNRFYAWLHPNLPTNVTVGARDQGAGE